MPGKAALPAWGQVNGVLGGFLLRCFGLHLKPASSACANTPLSCVRAGQAMSGKAGGGGERGGSLLLPGSESRMAALRAALHAVSFGILGDGNRREYFMASCCMALAL